MDIRLVKIEDEDDKYDVFINDVKVGHDYMSNNDSPIYIYVDEDKKDEILNYKIIEFDSSINTLYIPFSYENNSNFDWIQGMEYVTIRLQDWFDKKAPYVYIEVQADTDNWEKPFSLIRMVNRLEQLCKIDERVSLHLEDPEIINNGFGIELQITDSNISTQVVYQDILDIFSKLISDTVASLLAESKQDSLTSIFQFPDEIQVSCQQYLIYFSQFLEDLGITADTELKKELDLTLFKVIPKNKDEGLDKIRTALDIYLNAPNDRDFHLQVMNQNDIAVKQWEANVLHLKSQLILAQSVIQLKDATIEALQLSNFQYKQLIESNNLTSEDKETVIKDILEVKKVETTGFIINLPEILRKLKRLIKK